MPYKKSINIETKQIYNKKAHPLEQRWMPEHNAVPHTCGYCDWDINKIDRLIKMVKDQGEEIRQLKVSNNHLIGKCSVRQFFTHNYKSPDVKYIKDRLTDTQMTDLNDIKYKLEVIGPKNGLMITLTFDLAYFPHITDKSAQRDYLTCLLALARKEGLIGDYAGCYELQENGRVHIHAKTQFCLDPAKLLFMKYLTKRSEKTQRAVDIRQKEDIDEYITKDVTKDEMELNNFFFNRK